MVKPRHRLLASSSQLMALVPLATLLLLTNLGNHRVSTQSFQNGLCQVPPTNIDQGTFGFTSSLFQLFPMMSIPCDGYLTKWAMVSRTPEGSGLYLSVWRPQAGSSSYKLVGTTEIPPYTVTPNTWFEVILPDPYPVQKGDIVGLYYGNWNDPWSHNGYVPVTDPNQDIPGTVSANVGPALVLQKDADDIFTEASANNGNINASSAAIVSSRFPALIAYVDPNYGPLPTTQPPTASRRPCGVTVPTQAATTQPPTTTTTTPPPAVTTRRSCRRCGAMSAAMSAAITSSPFFQPAQKPPSQAIILPPSGAAGDGNGHSTQCFAPMRSAGNCNFTINKFSTKYFFNVPQRECQLFWFFEDCVKTSNLFNSIEECRASCRDFLSRDIMP